MATNTSSRKSAKTTETKPRTKSQIVSEISNTTGLSRKEVSSVFDCMSTMIKQDLSRRGPGTFNVAGLMKIKTKKKPAKPRRKGINPFTQEECWFKAKPASTAVKITALKALKEMV